MDEIKNKVLEEAKKGNIVIYTVDGLAITSLAEFIEQPVDAMLYDLNRSEEVVLTFIKDPKWINDYAVAQTIRALKSQINNLKSHFKILE